MKRRKRIKIDNDVKKIVNKDLYINNNKKKTKLFLTVFLLLIFILVICYSFILLYSKIKEKEIIIGDWTCNNNIELSFKSNSYSYQNINSIYKGSYSIKKHKDNEKEYYILSLINNKKEITGNYMLNFISNEEFTLKSESNNYINCKIKK